MTQLCGRSEVGLWVVMQQCGLSEARLWFVKSHRKTKGLAFQIQIKILNKGWFYVTWELERVTIMQLIATG